MMTAAAMPSSRMTMTKTRYIPPCEMEQSSKAERQKRGNQNHDDGKHVGEQGDPPDDAKNSGI